MQPTPEIIPPELDRRGANRAASMWVRQALTEQSEKIDKVSKDIHTLHDILSKSIPNADWEKHNKSHIILETREEEYKKNSAENFQRSEENRKFWMGVKRDIVKWAMAGAGLFVVGIFTLGSKAQFKIWSDEAVAAEPTVKIEKKNEK